MSKIKLFVFVCLSLVCFSCIPEVKEVHIHFSIGEAGNTGAVEVVPALKEEK